MKKMMCVIGVSLAVIGCAVHKFPRITPPIPHYQRANLTKQRAEEYFITARDYERKGMPEMAHHFYRLAYNLDPHSRTLRDIMIERAIGSADFALALKILKDNRRLDQLENSEKRIAAQLYIRMGELDRAIDLLETVIPMEPSDNLTLGVLYEQKSNLKKAISFYTEYLEDNPTSYATGMKVADLYVKEKKYAVAEQMYVHIDSIFTTYKVETLNRLARSRLLQSDTAAALDYFSRALRVDSTAVETLIDCAQLSINQGRLDDAIRYYQRLVNADPASTLFYMRTLALLYYYNKKYEQSEKILKQLLSQNPDNYELHFYLGMVLSSLGEHSLAEVEYWKTLSIKEDYADAWIQLCTGALKMHEWERALEISLNFKNKNPKDASSWRMHGYVLAHGKRYAEAIDEYKKALELTNRDLNIWFELGSAYERIGDYKKAEESFATVLHYNPTDASAANYLGYMWAERNKNLDSAQSLLTIALKQDPENGAYLDSYGWILFKKGDTAAALKYLLKAVEVISDDPVVYEHLGDVYGKMKEYKKALDAYGKSYTLTPENAVKIKQKIDEMKKLLHVSGQNERE
ncbi:MAG: tetratricopeptide repeat protein [Chitinivibrionales bacterium]|nr:tetratricopeptide repeat protein [Chitinivibrionales bacterium]